MTGHVRVPVVQLKFDTVPVLDAVRRYADLLALARSTTHPEEAATADRHARELEARHELVARDLDVYEEPAALRGGNVLRPSGVPSWRALLAVTSLAVEGFEGQGIFYPRSDGRLCAWVVGTRPAVDAVNVLFAATSFAVAGVAARQSGFGPREPRYRDSLALGAALTVREELIRYFHQRVLAEKMRNARAIVLRAPDAAEQDAAEQDAPAEQTVDEQAVEFGKRLTAGVGNRAARGRAADFPVSFQWR